MMLSLVVSAGYASTQVMVVECAVGVVDGTGLNAELPAFFQGVGVPGQFIGS